MVGFQITILISHYYQICIVGDFEIDPESGSVKIKNELDRETTPR